MTPYLINTTWVDLDHVLAIDELAPYDGTWDINGKVTLAFRSEPLIVRLGEVKWREGDAGYREPFIPAEPKAMWDQFIQAWKHRDRNKISITSLPTQPSIGLIQTRLIQ